jgi:putative N6-adenine-specific DNA methylase/tRNA (guanine6-N2)-methyltransferase
LRQSPFNRALSETDAFFSRHVRAIEIGGLYPYVFVLERTEHADRPNPAA